MSLISSALLTNGRKIFYGVVAICPLSLVCIGAMAGVDSFTNARLPDAATEELSKPPLPATTAIPSLTPVIGPMPVGTPPVIVRALSQYENAGTISIGATEPARQAALILVRTFLLRKWNQRQLGRLALASTSPTGQPMMRNFYVERNADGEWRVMLEADREAPEEFLFVEEIGVTADGRPILDPQPGDPPAVSRALHLKHKAEVNNGVVF